MMTTSSTCCASLTCAALKQNCFRFIAQTNVTAKTEDLESLSKGLLVELLRHHASLRLV
jgi:hypothetical protein